MNPEIWGPHAWFFLHTITLNYPNNPTREDIENNKKFIKYFGDIIPCDKCKKNFKIHLKELPLTDKVLKNKKSFINWMVEMHNKVNIINNKKKMSVSKFIKNYTQIYNSDNTNKGNSLFNNFYIILLIFIIIVLYLVYKYK